jgi:K+-sensing histidine kinase KdpD
MDPLPDPHAFGHLLHDVAGRVSALGLLMDTFEPQADALSADDRETLEGLRRAADELRRLVATLGELTRTTVHHGSLQPRDEKAGTLLRRALDAAIEDGIDLSVSLDETDMVAYADARLVTLLLRTLLRQLGHGSVPVSLNASGGASTVCFTVTIDRAATGSHTLDHFYNRLAGACGGSFAWVASGRGRTALITLPASDATGSRSVA